jgi:hypothetical protein
MSLLKQCLITQKTIITGTKMTTEELIEALDQRYGNPLAEGCELIQLAIKALKSQDERVKELEKFIAIPALKEKK